MKILFSLILIVFSINALADEGNNQAREKVRYSRVYLLTGFESVDESLVDDSKTRNSIHTLGFSFRVSDWGHIGMYYTTNDHYGWIAGFDLNKTSRLRLMVGQAKMTDHPDEESLITPVHGRDDDVYSFGVGLDFSLTESFGLTFQGFSYDSGSDSHNYELSAGVTFSF